jgi:hypothetical protein
MRLYEAAFALFISALAGSAGFGQEMKYIDLTGVTQRTELRHVPPPPPQYSPDGIGHGGGYGGGGVADCGPGARDPRALRSTVTWVNELEYRNGDLAVWELKLENVGSVMLGIPVYPHLSDLQPEDAAQPFKYSEIGFGSFVRSESQLANLGHVMLYGDALHSESILQLKPGEWIRVRAETHVNLANSSGTTPFEDPVRGGFWIHHVTYTSRPEGSSSMALGVCPRSEQGEGLLVRIHLGAKAETITQQSKP